jgi:hypothetical protein
MTSRTRLFGSSTEIALPVVEDDFAGHAVFEVLERVFHALGFDLVLVVLGVHEDVQRIGEIGVGDFLAVELDDVEFVVGAIDGFAGRTGEQVLHLHLDDRRVAAGFAVFGLEDNHRRRCRP